MSSPHVQGSIWWYAPNKPAPIVFAVLFAISFGIHVWQCIRYKSWKMSGLLPWGTAIIVGGFVTRALGAWNYKSLDFFIASSTLLVVGPPVFAAHLYIVLGRIMYYVPWLAPIHPGRVVTTFLGLDLLSGVILASGISRVANTSISETEREVGEALLKVGLILQVVMFVGFICLATFFHIRCVQNAVGSKVRSVMIVLYVTAILILERSIYRTIEYFEGYNGTIYHTEWTFWVFEASVMTIVTFTINAFAPARLLPQSNKVYLATDKVTEREGPGWVDKRNFCMTLIDPFDLASCWGSRRHTAHTKFWEHDEGEVVTYEPKYQSSSGSMA